MLTIAEPNRNEPVTVRPILLFRVTIVNGGIEERYYVAESLAQLAAWLQSTTHDAFGAVIESGGVTIRCLGRVTDVAGRLREEAIARAD